MPSACLERQLFESLSAESCFHLLTSPSPETKQIVIHNDGDVNLLRHCTPALSRLRQLWIPIVHARPRRGQSNRDSSFPSHTTLSSQYCTGWPGLNSPLSVADAPEQNFMTSDIFYKDGMGRISCDQYSQTRCKMTIRYITEFF